MMDDYIKERRDSFASYASSVECATVLLCPTCTKAIPEIIFKPVPKDLLAIVKCQCSNSTLEIPIEEFIATQTNLNSNREIVNCLEHHKKTTKYCLECIQWHCNPCIEKHQKIFKEHKSFQFELKVLCQQHRKLFIKQCKNCNLSICSECLAKHQNHDMINIIKVNDADFQQKFNKIDQYFEQYEEKKNFFMKKIEPQIVELTAKLLYLQRLKKEVEEAFVINNLINRSLKEYSSLLLTTSESIKEFPNYYLSKQFQILKFNSPEIDLGGDNLDEMCLKLKAFYNRNYLLKQVEVDEEKLQFQEDFSLKKIECFATFTEYTNIVSSLIQLNNGHLASGYQKEIKLWDNETFKCYANLSGHTDTVECLLQVNEDLISGSYDFSIKIWDLDYRKVKSTLTGHSNYVTALVLMRGGQLASSSDDKSIKIWNLKTNVCTATLLGHTGIIFSLTQLTDDKIASCSGDQTIKLWNPKKLFTKVNITFNGHTGIVFCVIQLTNGLLASGSYDKTIKVWKIKPTGCEATLTGHTDFVRSIYQLSDGRLMSGSADATIKFWDFKPPYSCLSTISSHRDVVRCLIQLDNGLIASGSWDMTIKLWTY